MIADYLIFAFVCVIVLSYLSIIHHFWLRDVFKKEATFDVRAGSEGNCEIRTRLGGHLTPASLLQTQVSGRP